MSFITRLFRRGKAETADTPGFILARAESQRYQTPDYSLAENQLRAYQVASWLYIAVNFVANGCTLQPFNVMTRTGEELEQVYNHPFEALLHHPNELQSRYDLLFSTFANLLLAGNVYWWMNRLPNSPPREIYALPAHLCKPVLGGQLGVVDYYAWNNGSGREYKLEPEDVIHFKAYHPTNMFVGLSAVEPLALSIEKDHKAQKYDLEFFASDKGKPAGVFGIKGRLDQTDMDALKRTLRGAGRSLAVMENIEEVQYIQMALDYVNMEFINNRQFTKEEVYATIAPGLSSVLAVNATEANSRAGQETIDERAIYPRLVAVAEGITNRALPLYGDNLVGQFEDPRKPNRELELAEQEAYSRTHTVNEVRARWYGDDPLPDERGELMVAQIGPAAGHPPEGALLTMGSEPDPPPPPDPDQEPEAESPNEKRAKALGELKAWRAFALKRVGKANPRPFEFEYVPADIAAVLNDAQVDSEIKSLFTKATDILTSDEPYREGWHVKADEEPEQLNYRLEDLPLEEIGVPDLTEEDMQAAFEDLLTLMSEEEAQALIDIELGDGTTDPNTD